ncbi:hypothetical protein SAMN05216548_114143 [Faunimonas pinastri]|uniref:Uncharacterized protein n=1 Tax=Faunimonas pinastri TaxID=1855383 RepID=A0A1H9N1D1_9HYPH|nr:hypothetical protein [Faunimonas pinastri]SER29790.1 hypothetical protein SAMN05216548_114143 [Faunimonas pinastri]
MKLAMTFDLAAYKAEKVTEVNTQIGKIRSVYLTVIPGQELTYLTKLQEATTALADPNVEAHADSYPLIRAEAEAKRQTIAATAQVTKNTADQWTLVNSKLENLRYTLKVAIDAAKKRAEVDEAVQVDWAAISAGLGA